MCSNNASNNGKTIGLSIYAFETTKYYFLILNKILLFLNVLFQCGPKWLSLVCTTVFLVYHLSWLTYDVYTQISDGKPDDELYFTKLPNWGYTMLIVIPNLVDFITTTLVYCTRQDIVDDKGTEKLLKLLRCCVKLTRK